MGKLRCIDQSHGWGSRLFVGCLRQKELSVALGYSRGTYLGCVVYGGVHIGSVEDRSLRRIPGLTCLQPEFIGHVRHGKPSSAKPVQWVRSRYSVKGILAARALYVRDGCVFEGTVVCKEWVFVLLLH